MSGRAACRLGDHDLPGLGGGAEVRRDVDRVAESREVARTVRARDHAEPGDPGVHRDAGGQAACGRRGDQRMRRIDRPARVVGAGQTRQEDGDDPVA